MAGKWKVALEPDSFGAGGPVRSLPSPEMFSQVVVFISF